MSATMQSLLAGLAISLALGSGSVYSQTVLLEAVEQGDSAKVREILSEKRARGSVSVSDDQGQSPLLRATWLNHIDIARQLIRAGADVNQSDSIHDSPYLVAGAEGRLEILRMTLENGADLRSVNRYGGTALIPAAEHGYVDVVRLLLAAGVDPNHVNYLGWTALHEAIVLSDGGAEHQEVLRLLIKAGADVNLPDRQGVLPLSLARQRSQTEMAHILEQAGANP
ncbi:ankyrin repeat domain-containing protein [Alcaligenes faecalis]|uniref:ankyrin repeat domain-containing protein n=1 Tax=Alcaligenes faecalis TaxID=511 RepID=UPI0024BC129F|nr:ankyrin repeat domain-containing protein [Alcaligenes faecalis]WHQ43995.1 ankyrin repeat domain-containing protein [Alcaligenes faecalis]